MAREHRRGRILIHAFVIQANHYHIIAESPLGEISEAMRVIQNQYVRRYNRRNDRDGPLYRGRFGSRPIRSEADRWTVLRYIDLHSVKSGITSTPGTYPHGSAIHYLQAKGPPWLTRHDVEAQLTQGLRPYEPAMYESLLARPLTQAERELIELRMRRGSFMDDPLDDLLNAGPPGIHDWMVANAERADGTRPGIAIASPARLHEVIAEHRAEDPDHAVRTGRRRQGAWGVLYAGLLREACALTYQEIAVRSGISSTAAQKRVAAHRKLLRESREYGIRSAAILAEVLEDFANPGGLSVVKRS